MVSSTRFCWALVTTAFGLSLSGCGGLSKSSFGPSMALLPNTDRPVLGEAQIEALSPIASSSEVAAVTASEPNAEQPRMTPDSNRSLMYVSNWGSNTVTVYTYHNAKRLAQVGTLTGFASPTQPCVDKARNVYIPQYARKQIVVYAHGGTSPIAHLMLHSPGRPHPTGCSVDLKNGNVAIANFKNGSKAGDVNVFAPGRRKPTRYKVANVAFPEFVGYDKQGNLFADGLDASGVFALAELPKGSKNFSPLTVSGGPIYSPGEVLWGGTHLLVGDQNYRNAGKGSAIYQISVSGSVATVHGVVTLSGTNDVVGFWKRGTRKGAKIAAADFGAAAAPVYKFPSGSLFATLTHGISKPFGLTISP